MTGRQRVCSLCMEEKVSPLGSTRLRRVHDIDFRRPMKFTRDQLRQLEHAHDSFCRSASSRLSAELGEEFQLDFVSSDQLPYSTAIAEEIPRQALVLVLRVEPLGTEVALVVEVDTAVAVIDRVLGGRGLAHTSEAQLSELEMAVATRGFTGLINDLSATWNDLCDVQFVPLHAETSPSSVQIAPPSEPTLLLTFTAQMADTPSEVKLVLPYRSLERVVDRLAAMYGSEEMDTPAPAMRTALSRVAVPLRAEVGFQHMTVNDLLALQEGDVMRLPQAAEEGVILHIGDQAAYHASHGAYGNRRAVQIHHAVKGFRE